MSSPLDQRARTGRGAATRAGIAAAAGEVLLTGGIAAVTHRAVAARAGVALGSATYYFAARDDLVVAAVEHAAGAEVARAQAVAALAPVTGSGPLAARLVEALVGSDRLTDPARVAALYERILEASRTPGTADQVARWTEAMLDVVASVLGAAGVAGITPALVLALVDGSVVGWLGLGGPPTDLLAAVAGGLEQLGVAP